MLLETPILNIDLEKHCGMYLKTIYQCSKRIVNSKRTFKRGKNKNSFSELNCFNIIDVIIKIQSRTNEFSLGTFFGHCHYVTN